MNVSYDISSGTIICLDCNTISDYKTRKIIDFGELSYNMSQDEITAINHGKEIGIEYKLYK